MQDILCLLFSCEKQIKMSVIYVIATLFEQ